MAPITRGGAEDMHKARGQGHEKNPRPRPSTALQRTNPLEAKDRNAQGQVPRHTAEVMFKEKVFAPKSKNSALLEPRTAHFRGLADFEAKDFQLHPRGLHLCP